MRTLHPLVAQKHRSAGVDHDALHWEGISVFYGGQGPETFPEHYHPEVQVSVRIQSLLPVVTRQTVQGSRERPRLIAHSDNIIASQQPHGGRWEAGTEIVAFYLHPDFIGHAADESFGRSSVEILGQNHAQDRLIQQLGLALVREFHAGESLDPLYVESLANVLTGYLIRHHSTFAQPVLDVVDRLCPDKLRQVTDYIEEHLEGPLAIAGVAREVNMSPHRFGRLFKATTGLTPYQYVMERRVEQAKMLLAHTELPLAQVGDALGFSSQSHFTAVFRRFTGVTPKAYRNAL